MSLKLECHSNWNLTQIRMSLKLESHLNWNVTQIGMSLTFKSHQNGNFTQIRMSLKLECHKNCNVTQNTTTSLHQWLIRFFFVVSNNKLLFQKKFKLPHEYFFISILFMIISEEGKALARRHFLGGISCFQGARRRFPKQFTISVVKTTLWKLFLVKSQFCNKKNEIPLETYRSTINCSTEITGS